MPMVAGSGCAFKSDEGQRLATPALGVLSCLTDSQ